MTAVRAVPLQRVEFPAHRGQFLFQGLESDRLGAQIHTHPGAGRIQNIDGLVGQPAAAQITAGKLSRALDRVVAHIDAVGPLVLRHNAPQDGHRLLQGRLVQLDQLETSGQGRILLEILLVLAPGGGRDGSHFAPRQGRFEQVRPIAAPGRVARPHEGMGLVDEQDGRHGRGLDLVDDALEALLELALDAGPGLKPAHVQADDAHPLEGVGVPAPR